MSVEKTPVTILQEMMNKIGSLPNYELCQNDLNNSQIFTYKVTCDSITAVGTGRSKKEAKQAAANEMLVKLKMNNGISHALSQTNIPHNPYVKQKQSQATIITKPQAMTVSPAVSEETLQAENTIQELNKICLKHQLQEPIYKELEATGPAHARTYFMECAVSTFKVNATGKSKKQAKHNAAQNMINELKEVFFNVPLSTINQNEIKLKKKTSNSEINLKTSENNKSSKLKTENSVVENEHTESINHSNDNKVSKLKDLSMLTKECQENICENNMSRLKQEFLNLLEMAKITFHHMLLQTKEGPLTFMLILQLNTVPPILEMSLGKTSEEAEINTIAKVIDTLKNTFK